tara:strand:- start:16602 stop:17717 length:1116 start_codon:yes stop_codon:yes gene_type:complete
METNNKKNYFKLNNKFWKNKKVLVTGHTGFKGGWLCMFLNNLGCKISGYALNPAGKKNFFEATNLKKILTNDFRKNINNLGELDKAIKKIKPEIIFHLAAQSSVIESFKNSHNTITSNIVGTANIMEVSKKYSFIKSVVIITTDKVYQNYKEKKYFDENSQLGGDDIYSGSKACCELLVHSYRKSFFQNSKCNIATVRAGNCFGGGDWTPDRIVKDILENFYKNKNLVLRNPNATRPWQHVLEPLMGYLKLAEKLHSKDGNQFCEPWNFGPSLKQNMKVKNLVEIFQNKMKSKSKIIINKNDKRFHNKKINIFESKNLNINSKKISKRLNWKPKLSLDNSIDLTVIWYKSFRAKKNVFDLTNKQIKYYLDL